MEEKKTSHKDQGLLSGRIDADFFPQGQEFFSDEVEKSSSLNISEVVNLSSSPAVSL